MSSLALMRLLESAPDRYDAGMRAITLGRVTRLHAAVAAAAATHPEMRILEIGCGTGAVTERLVDLGAQVTALDQSPEMLERAQQRLANAPRDAVRWLERTASEIDALPEASFDAVGSSRRAARIRAASVSDESLGNTRQRARHSVLDGLRRRTPPRL